MHDGSTMTKSAMRSARSTMKALVYEGPGQVAFEERPKPRVRTSTDAIVRITHTTICGTDLHIIKGNLPTVAPGRILGHEGVGIIDAVGPNVNRFRVGDRVVISCVSSCGKCLNCRRGMSSHCQNGGGWILGNLIDGTQAEFVRIPFADTSLYPVPDGVEEEVLVMLSDLLPTGFESGTLSGWVGPGGTVAIVGGGLVAMAAILTARLYEPAELLVIDVDDARLEVATKFGATRIFNNSDGKAAAAVMAHTRQRGVDVVIDVNGHLVNAGLGQAVVREGGHIAYLGVHGRPVQRQLGRVALPEAGGLPRPGDTITMPKLPETGVEAMLQPIRSAPHRFALTDVMEAYDTFGNTMQERAMKVIISNA